MARRSGALDRSAKRAIVVIAVVVVMIMLLMTAYYGTGLSMKIEEYTTAEVPLAGVGFSVILENDGAFTKTKVVHCEVRTSNGAYEASRGVTLGPGEKTNIIMMVPIIGLDVNDIEEKKCYTSLL
ncbi:MAG TPA: hypothetical protein PK446_02010 [Methanomassiliicoccaceae archaeon]|nr:hypothetical protein [Methanomassiliicoccaceae archaeon]